MYATEYLAIPEAASGYSSKGAGHVQKLESRAQIHQEHVSTVPYISLVAAFWVEIAK